MLKAALRLRPGIVVIDMPEHLEHKRKAVLWERDQGSEI